MLQRKRTTNVPQGSGSIPSVLELPEHMNNIATPWMPSIPYMPNEYWDPQVPYASSSLVLQDQFALHDPTFIATQYSSPAEPTDYHETLHANAHDPPPFRFTSSSLSTALSLSTQAPQYGGSSPIDQPVNREPTPITSVPESSLSHSGTASRDELTATSSYPSPCNPQFSPPISQEPVSAAFYDSAQHLQADCVEHIHATFSTTPPQSQVQSQADLNATTITNDTPNTSRYYRTPAQKRKASVGKPSPYCRKSKDQTSVPRLSANLPVMSE